MQQKKNFDFEFNRAETAQLKFSEQKIKQEISQNFSQKSFDLSFQYFESIL